MHGRGAIEVLLAVKVLILIALVKLLVESENALLCAVLYSGVSTLFGLLAGMPLLIGLFGATIAFGYSFVYFWLLARFLGGGFTWWLILVAGLVAPAIIDSAIVSLFAC